MTLKKISTTHRGHNAHAPGAAGNGLKEHIEAQRITDKILKITKSIDCTDDKGKTADQNLVNILVEMNMVGYGTHVSNHLNAFNGQARGFEVWHKLGDAWGKKVATEICNAVCAVTGWTNRGAKATTALYVVRNAKDTSILIEWGFIDNKKDMDIFKSKLDAAVNAMTSVFGYSKPSDKPSGLAKNPKPISGAKVGDKVKIYDALYANSAGAGKSIQSRGKYGNITRIVAGAKKPYLVDNLGWAHANDLQAFGKNTTTNVTKNKWINKKGTAKITTNAGIYLRLKSEGDTTDPLKLGKLLLKKGDAIKYDKILVQKDGHVFIRQPRFGGYGWLPVADTKNGKVVGGYWVSGVSI